MKRFYLAHPFNSRFVMRQWELIAEVETGVELVNPFYDTERTDVDCIDNGIFSRYENLIASDIVKQDLKLVSSCDGIIGLISGDFSVGTIFELAYAYYIAQIPLYIVCTNGHEEHPWIKHHAEKVYTTLEALYEDLENL